MTEGRRIFGFAIVYIYWRTNVKYILKEMLSIGHVRFPSPEFGIQPVICLVFIYQRTFVISPKPALQLHFLNSGLIAFPIFVSFLNPEYGAFLYPE